MSDNKPFACYDHIVFLHARHRVGTRLQATHVQLWHDQALVQDQPSLCIVYSNEQCTLVHGDEHIHDPVRGVR